MTTTYLDPELRGEQPAGPKRWLRAEQSAKANPHHANAIKYFARVDAAEVIAKMDSVNERHGWLHMSQPKRRWGGAADPVYRYQTCSTYCAILQLQLDTSTAGLEQLHALDLANGYLILVERPADSKRHGACKVCGGTVPRPNVV